MEAISGSAWNDPVRWEEAKKPSSCKICVNGHPNDVIAELGTTWVTAGREAPLPGYACVVSKRHVIEPFELSSAGQAAFWNEAMLTARALCELMKPAKMNYEIHGNTVPHLHLHLFPRFAGDPYVGGPIDTSRTSFTRTVGYLEEMGRQIAAAYHRDGSKQSGG